MVASNRRLMTAMAACCASQQEDAVDLIVTARPEHTLQREQKPRTAAQKEQTGDLCLTAIISKMPSTSYNSTFITKPRVCRQLHAMRDRSAARSEADLKANVLHQHYLYLGVDPGPTR